MEATIGRAGWRGVWRRECGNELHLNYPFMGSRQLCNMLVRESHRVGRTHVSTLMKRMGIEAIYRKPGTSA